jgi:hypothetical protein
LTDVAPVTMQLLPLRFRHCNVKPLNVCDVTVGRQLFGEFSDVTPRVTTMVPDVYGLLNVTSVLLDPAAIVTVPAR